jgi:hypothetical protein
MEETTRLPNNKLLHEKIDEGMEEEEVTDFSSTSVFRPGKRERNVG